MTSTESEFSHGLPEGADDTKKNKFAQYCLDSYHIHHTWTGDTLSEYFTDEFQEFSIKDFAGLPNSLRRELRDYLLKKGVYVRKVCSIQISNALYELVKTPASAACHRSVSFAPDVTTISSQDNGGNNSTQKRTSCSAMTQSGKAHKATARIFDRSKSDAASAEGLTVNL